MYEKEKIDTGKWNTYLKLFTSMNRGRLIQVQNRIQEKVYDLTNNDMPFQRISKQSSINSERITIHFGNKQVVHRFIIESPVEIWHEYNYEGQTMAIEILNKKYDKAIILFKSYF
jgi:hypothetical protein